MMFFRILFHPHAISYNRNNIFLRIHTFCQFSSTSHQETFRGEKDRFNGITVDSTKENSNQQNFLQKLEESLTKWTSEGRRCIWFKVNIKDASYVPILAQKGFNFHHARDDCVMMYKWLPMDSEPNLPPACHTNLGVGALVLNDSNQILAVSEKHYDYPHWKLPGGYVEKGEDIIDAAVREVKEETGVETTFQSLITIRHSHKMMYDNSDIYVLLLMKALTNKITLSHREVKECKWMEIDDYSNHPHVHEFNRLVVRKALEYRNRKLKLDIKKQTVKWSQYVREINFLMVEDCEYH